jgi:hypothetical protein
MLEISKHYFGAFASVFLYYLMFCTLLCLPYIAKAKQP